MRHLPALLFFLAAFPLAARVDTVRADDGKFKQMNTARTAWEESVILSPGGPCVVKSIEIYYAGGTGTDTVFVTGDAAEGSIPPTQYSWPYNTLIGPIPVEVTGAGWKSIDVSAADLHLGGYDRVVIQHRTYTGKPMFGQDASLKGSSFYFDPTTPNTNFYNIPGIFYVAAGDYMVRVLVEYAFPAANGGSAPPPPPVFTDVTSQAGILDANGATFGSDLATAVDWDGDGYDDLAIGTQFFHNEGNGTFKRATLPISGSGSVWADIDNDGDQDAFAVNGWGNDKIWRNDGNGTFTDITTQTAIMNNAPTVTPLWLDMDHDGDMDLFIANGRKEENGTETYYQDRLFRNKGGLVFEDITASSAIATSEVAPYYDCWAASLCDYNNDGWTDIFVATYRLAPDRLYKNNGDGTFSEVSRTTNVIGLPTADPSTFGHGMGSDWGDWNNDGYVDLAVGNLGHPDWRASVSNPSLLFVNSGPPSWTFTDKHAQAGLKFYEMNAGMAWADLDCDADLDLWHGQISYEAFGAGATRNARLYMNQGKSENYRLIDRTWELGARIHGAWTAVRLDYDRDGDVDLLCASGTERVRLFRNDMPQTGASLTIQLASKSMSGTTASAYGARVTVYAGETVVTRQLPGTQIGGRCAQHSNDLFFGLGNVKSIDRCVVTWPNGVRQEATQLGVNRTWKVTDVGVTVQSMDHARVRLRAPATGAVDLPATVLLQWAAVGTSATYDVQVARGADFSVILEERTALTQEELSLSTLPSGIPLYWRVRATDAQKTSQWCAPWTFTIGRPAPMAVTLIAPSAAAPAVPVVTTFKWTTARYATTQQYPSTYDVVISTSADFTANPITRTALADTVSDTIALQPTTTYHWRVRAVNGTVQGPWSETGQFTTYGTPRSRELITPADGSTNVTVRPACKWHDDPWADSYTIELDTMSDFSTAVRKNAKDTTVVVLPALKYSKLYHWRVRGKNLAGDGAWSPVWTFTTATSTDVDAESSPSAACTITTCSPAPVLTTCTFTVTTLSSEHVSISVMDAQGGRVARIFDGMLDGGAHAFTWDAATAAQGAYFIVVDHERGTVSAPVRVMR